MILETINVLQPTGMTINTKLNIGDTFYHMKDNKVCTNTVESISINVRKHGIEIVYLYTPVERGYEKSVLNIIENRAFLTKQELLCSL